MQTSQTPLSIEQLLDEYRSSVKDILHERERYEFPECAALGLDVYNPFLFELNGQQMLIARVEAPEDETRSVCKFFYRESADSLNWFHDPEPPSFDDTQDAFITVINDQVVVGGVKIEYIENAQGKREITGWKTEIYAGDDIYSLELKVAGPYKMKDIRLVQLPAGKVGVFTRPQGEKGGRGKVGFAVFDSMDNITAEALQDAPIIESLFIDGEWGGVNHALPLVDGKIGIFGHIARFDENNKRHYFPFSCEFDPERAEISDMRLLCTKEATFPEVQGKRPDLDNVFFTGSAFKHNGKLRLSGGVADRYSASVAVNPSFIERLATDTVRITRDVTTAGNLALSTS